MIIQVCVYNMNNSIVNIIFKCKNKLLLNLRKSKYLRLCVCRYYIVRYISYEYLQLILVDNTYYNISVYGGKYLVKKKNCCFTIICIIILKININVVCLRLI